MIALALRPYVAKLPGAASLLTLLFAVCLSGVANADEDSAVEQAADQVVEPGAAPGREFDCRSLGMDVRPQDEVWIVSTRKVGCGQTGPTEVYRLGASEWEPSDHATLHRSLDRGAPIVVYAHGNQTSFSVAAYRGSHYYHQFAESNPPAMQFIIWSWPSDRIKGPLRDVRAKASRADYEALLMADFLATLPPRSPLTLIGYSFGSRVVSGALAELAEMGVDRPAVQAVLLAAAVDTHWLAPGGRHEAAWRLLDGLLVLYNTCDPALKRFRMTSRCYNPAALGYTGPWWAGQVPGRVESYDMCCELGKTHDEWMYIETDASMRRVRDFYAVPYGVDPIAVADFRP